MKNNTFCHCCGQEIDDETCWCGSDKKYHGFSENHMFIPMGCTCYYHKTSTDLTDIEKHLDEQLGIERTL